MASSSEYMICHPEKLGISDIFSILVFRRRLLGSELVESNCEETKVHSNFLANLVTLIIYIIQKILLWLNEPLASLGIKVEFFLNLVALNGGILQLILQIIKGGTGSLVYADRESADFRSIIGHLDGRTDLYKTNFKVPKIENINDINALDLCMMASKIAYENSAYVNNVVTVHWQMHLVGFYNFWNEDLEEKATQAFIFSDRPKDAQFIVVAFRGTEAFNTKDWSSDIDLSWLSMGEMGKVHIGFMKALGLQNDKDYKMGWPKDYTGNKKLAYYTIRSILNTLLQENKTAKILITGHSLGGALAVLFPSILVLHNEDTLLRSLAGVFTFGQPRVGDTKFGNVMNAELGAMYQRVVFRYDVVTRIPFEGLISGFSHFGDCLYFYSWYKGKVLKKEPNPNYFNPLYILSKYINAWLDLFRALFIGITQGEDFKESLTSILFRIMGLFFPGLASHSPRDYVNSVRLGKITIKEDYDEIV